MTAARNCRSVRWGALHMSSDRQVSTRS
jgi:hypothetical protein